MPGTTGTTPDIDILYEDDHLLAVHKPPGLLSQKDKSGDPDLLSICKQYNSQKNKKRSSRFLGLVHRLDRPTEGVMVFAKRSSAASGLSEQIRNRSFQKRYLAVATGKIPPNGVLIHHLSKDPGSNRVHVVRAGQKGAQKAEMSFERKEYLASRNLSLADLNLITGRPHQIRVQLSAEGYPVLGDGKYGTVDSDSGSLALLASEIRFKHPDTGERLIISTSPPAEEPWTWFPSLGL